MGVLDYLRGRFKSSKVENEVQPSIADSEIGKDWTSFCRAVSACKGQVAEESSGCCESAAEVVNKLPLGSPLKKFLEVDRDNGR